MRLKKAFFPVLILVGCASLAPTSAFSQIIIDDFTSGAGFVGTTSDDFSSASGTQTGTMFGGTRDEQLLCYSNCYLDTPSYSTMTITTGTPTGSLSVTVPPDGMNTAQITWDKAGTTTVNLSGESGIELTFNNVSAPLEVNMYLSSSAGTSTYGASLANPGTVISAEPRGTETLFLPFSSFFGSASLASVSSIELILGGAGYGLGDDASSASYTLTSVEAVPEPGTMALLSSGLAVVALMLWCRRPASTLGARV